MAGNSNTVDSDQSFPMIKGLNVMMTSLGVMQITLHSTQAGEKLSVAYYVACILLVLAFSLLLIAKYLPKDECNLALVLEQVGIYLVTTSLFFSFSMSIPPLIWAELIFWAVYLILIIIIIWCFYYRFAHQPKFFAQASTTGIQSV